MSIEKGFKIYVADTICQADCDSLYEIISGTTQNYIISMNGMIHEDGTIELSKETKTILK